MVTLQTTFVPTNYDGMADISASFLSGAGLQLFSHVSNETGGLLERTLAYMKLPTVLPSAAGPPTVELGHLQFVSSDADTVTMTPTITVR